MVRIIDFGSAFKKFEPCHNLIHQYNLNCPIASHLLLFLKAYKILNIKVANFSKTDD